MTSSSTSATVSRHRSLPRRPFSSLSSISPSFVSFSFHRRPLPTSITASTSSRRSTPVVSLLQALIFDCDGVILESEDLHRQAYNDAFAYFDVRCPPSADKPLNWSSEFYDVFQNTVGGGKPKMRWYFKEHGWPTSTVFQSPPEGDENREKLIDILQDWKTERYKEIIKSGNVEPRPGVLRLMDEARAAGRKVAVCSAATKSSVVLCLENLLGLERFQTLDCFLAGDDVKQKKPDPSIYVTASKILGIQGNECLVVEDSVIGLQAARGAGMPCIITYTSSTASQDFSEAIAIYPNLSSVRYADLDLFNMSSLAFHASQLSKSLSLNRLEELDSLLKDPVASS
ncbi:unnamed protein product [Rhodiola kirilowii]